MTRLVLPKLAFLFHIPEMYYHYRPVLELLPAGSYDILLPEDPPEILLQIMAANDYSYSFIPDLLAAHTMYKYLVTDHLFQQDYHLLQNIGVRQIRFISELGHDRLQLANYNRFYDLILCFGRYQISRLEFCRNTRFYAVGWPRLDSWFQHPEVDRDSILDYLNCDRYRPVLLWVPTFGELSSIPYYAESIAHLTDLYNVVVKPHDYTLLEEPENLKILRQMKMQTILTEPTDELLLYLVADYVLSDYGGAPFGAVYTEQRLILLDIPDAFSHEFTGIGSSDITLRNHFPSLDPGDNPDAWYRLLEGDDEPWRNSTRLYRMRERLFAPVYGRAAQEAANILGAIDLYL